MAAATNTITTTTLANAKVREIDFAELFAADIRKLTEALGITRKIAKTAGSTLKLYKASGTLNTNQPGEGETIPLSAYTVSPTTYADITLKKWRKATTAEAITEYGYDQAVSMTSERMLKDVQKNIRSEFFTFLASNAVSGGTAATLQAKLATAWGKLEALYEDTDADAVYFVNPLDVAEYLATATITTQTAFGMTYVKDFLGLGTVIINSDVPRGTVYATAKNNLILYYIPVNGADLGEAFDFTSDATGYIGIHETPDYSNMTASDTVVSGLTLFAEVANGLIKVTQAG